MTPTAGIGFKPQCYLSDQWGCPSGVPVIGIPFFARLARASTLSARELDYVLAARALSPAEFADVSVMTALATIRTAGHQPGAPDGPRREGGSAAGAGGSGDALQTFTAGRWINRACAKQRALAQSCGG